MRPKFIQRRTLVWATAAILLAGSGATLALGGGDCRGGGGMLAAAYRLENLSATQREQLDALRVQQRQEAGERREAWRDNRQALRGAMRDGAAPETVRPLAEQLGQQMSERIVRRAEVRQSIDAILTPEQREQLAAEGPAGKKRGRHRPY